MSLDRIDADIEALLVRDPAQAERFFLSRVVPSLGSWVSPEQWASRVRGEGTPVIADGETITLGFVGLLRVGAALIGCRVSDGHMFVLGIWEGTDKEPISRIEVKATFDDAMRRYTVERCYGDPNMWQAEVEEWVIAWGETVVVEWWTHRPTPMAHAVDRMHVAIETAGSQISHDGNEQLAEQIGKARTKKGTAGTVIVEQSDAADQQIPAAKAAVLAYEARGDVLATEPTPPPKKVTIW